MAFHADTNEPLGFDEDDPAVDSRSQTPLNPGATPYQPSFPASQQAQGGYAPMGAYLANPNLAASTSRFAPSFSPSAPSFSPSLSRPAGFQPSMNFPPASSAGTALPLGSSFRNERGFAPGGPPSPRPAGGFAAHQQRDFYNPPPPPTMSSSGPSALSVGAQPFVPASASAPSEQQGRQYAPSKPDGSPFSVKYLTCWYWANTKCKKPEWECAYSHHYTGIMSEMPVQKGPGRTEPMVAGANARKPAPVFTDWRNLRSGPYGPEDPAAAGPFSAAGFSRPPPDFQPPSSLGPASAGFSRPPEYQPSSFAPSASGQRERTFSTGVATPRRPGASQGAEQPFSSGPASAGRPHSSAFRDLVPASVTPTRSTFAQQPKDPTAETCKSIIGMQTKLTRTFESGIEKTLKEHDQDLLTMQMLLDQVKAGDANADQIVHLLGRIVKRSEDRRDMSWDAINKFQNEKKTLKRVAEEEGLRLDL